MCRLQKQPVVFAQRLVYLKASPQKRSQNKRGKPSEDEMRGNLSIHGTACLLLEDECTEPDELKGTNNRA